MPLPRLVSVRWCANHGVLLRDSQGGRRFVRPNGALTVGEVSKLMGVYPLQVYRLVQRGVFSFKDRAGIATVPLGQIREYQNGHK